MTATERTRRPNATRSLYELSQDMLRIDAAFDECEGDLSKADPMLVAEFDALGDEVLVKMDGILDYRGQLRSDAAGARTEAEFWMRKALALEAKEERMKAATLAFMQRHGYHTLRTARGRVLAIQANGGVLPVKLADLIDPATLPDNLVRRVPNLEAIRTALEDGAELPFAVLGERGSHLRVR